MRIVALIAAAALLAGCGGRGAEADLSRALTTVPRFGDADPYDWSEGAPWHYPVHGIDVSKWQGDIDWHEVRSSGVAFAFLKATEGGDVLDDRFADNWSAARRAGVARGAYHFYYFCRTAAEQALWFISHVPRERGALPPVLDMEWNHRSRTCPGRPDGETVRREMGVFLGLVGAHYGRRPLVYTTLDFWRDNELWRVSGYEFWLRSTAGHPSETYPGQRWSFWQYTGTGLVPGVAGSADINVFAGSPAEWQRWALARAQ